MPWLPWASNWRVTLALIVLATLAKLIYLFALCPYTLVEDEAHYWEWSRHLEWSYYTKGPGVALTIAGFARFFAALGIGISEAVIRTPAVLASGVLALSIALLTRGIARDHRVAFLAVVLTLFAPGFHLTSILMTIDGPYLACWGIACHAAWRAMRKASGRAWIVLGVSIGIGFLYKYTILLLLPGLAAFMLAHRGDASASGGALHLHPRWRSLALLSLSIALLGFVPVIVWNATHDWGTIHHLLGHLGVAGGDTQVTQHASSYHYQPAWTLSFLAAELGLMGPALFISIGASVRAWRASGAEPRDMSASPMSFDPPIARADLWFLLACAIPIHVFYLLVSFIAEPEGNWPLAGHITLLPLAALGILWAVERLHERREGWRARRARGERTGARPQTLPNAVWLIVLVLSPIFLAVTLRADLVVRSAPARAVVGFFVSRGVMQPGRTFLPIGRIMHADEIAIDAARVQRELDERTGQRSFVVAQQYGRASQLAFYMPGRPVVYCSSSKSEGRKTQYDLWPQTNLDDPALLGRPALLVGGALYQWQPAFERVEEIGQLQGETKKGRLAFIGYGYKGFPKPKPAAPARKEEAR
jgi:4-amino-4-deoxy-L-arabinose transferase-like glycosyltransferase